MHNLIFWVTVSYTERVGIAVNIFARTRRVLGSNLVRYTGYLTDVRRSFNPSLQAMSWKITSIRPNPVRPNPS
jgi:hypothetical protein